VKLWAWKVLEKGAHDTIAVREYIYIQGTPNVSNHTHI
jgi:hypothetical protein